MKVTKAIIVIASIVLTIMLSIYGFFTLSPASSSVKPAFGLGWVNSASEVSEDDKIHGSISAEEAIEVEWYRNHLGSDEKIALYDAMEAAIASLAPGVTVPSMPKEDVMECYWAVIYDHPEFFWLSREYKFHQDSEETFDRFDFVYYITDRNEIESKLHDYEIMADTIISGADYGTSSKEDKIGYIYEWIGRNTSYVEGDHDQTMMSVFDDHESVCAGYTQALQYILLRAGVPCVRIGGHSINSEGVSDGNHTWLCIVPTNHIYFYDVTWDDQQNPKSMQRYFGKDQEEFSRTHIEDNYKSPREDGERDDAQELVETAVKVSTGEHLEMPERVDSSDFWSDDPMFSVGVSNMKFIDDSMTSKVVSDDGFSQEKLPTFLSKQDSSGDIGKWSTTEQVKESSLRGVSNAIKSTVKSN